jgi:hypothetical protein
VFAARSKAVGCPGIRFAFQQHLDVTIATELHLPEKLF